MHKVGIELHELFSALSDPTRIRIVRLMMAVKSEVCLCEMAESLMEPEYKLSRHVKVLKASGLLTSVRDGKWVYHGLVQDEPFLKSIFKTLAQFPDQSKATQADVQRFVKRLKNRETGRCRTETPLTSIASRRMI